MEQVKITLVKSMIDRSHKQKNTLKTLGLTKREQSVVMPNNDQVQGMIRKVNHLIKVESA